MRSTHIMEGIAACPCLLAGTETHLDLMAHIPLKCSQMPRSGQYRRGGYEAGGRQADYFFPE